MQSDKAQDKSEILAELKYNLDMLRRDLSEEFQKFCDFDVSSKINLYFKSRDLDYESIEKLVNDV